MQNLPLHSLYYHLQVQK